MHGKNKIGEYAFAHESEGNFVCKVYISMHILVNEAQCFSPSLKSCNNQSYSFTCGPDQLLAANLRQPVSKLIMADEGSCLCA